MESNPKLLLAEAFELVKRGDREVVDAEEAARKGWGKTTDKDLARLRAVYKRVYNTYLEALDRFNSVRRASQGDADLQNFCAGHMKTYMAKCEDIKQKEGDMLLPANVNAGKKDGYVAGLVLFERLPQQKLRRNEDLVYDATLEAGTYHVMVKYLDQPGVSSPKLTCQIVVRPASGVGSKHVKTLPAFTQLARTIGVGVRDAPARLVVKVTSDAWIRDLSVHVVIQTLVKPVEAPQAAPVASFVPAAPPRNTYVPPVAAPPASHASAATTDSQSQAQVHSRGGSPTGFSAGTPSASPVPPVSPAQFYPGGEEAAAASGPAAGAADDLFFGDIPPRATHHDDPSAPPQVTPAAPSPAGGKTAAPLPDAGMFDELEGRATAAPSTTDADIDAGLPPASCGFDFTPHAEDPAHVDAPLDVDVGAGPATLAAVARSVGHADGAGAPVPHHAASAASLAELERIAGAVDAWPSRAAGHVDPSFVSFLDGLPAPKNLDLAEEED